MAHASLSNLEANTCLKQRAMALLLYGETDWHQDIAYPGFKTVLRLKSRRFARLLRTSGCPRAFSGMCGYSRPGSGAVRAYLGP